MIESPITVTPCPAGGGGAPPPSPAAVRPFPPTAPRGTAPERRELPPLRSCQLIHAGPPPAPLPFPVAPPPVSETCVTGSTWCLGGRTLRSDPGDDDAPEITPESPNEQMTPPASTALVAASPSVRGRSARHSPRRHRSRPAVARRPSAPWRTGCSTKRHESAERTKIATTCKTSRSRLGLAPSGVESTMTGTDHR